MLTKFEHTLLESHEINVALAILIFREHRPCRNINLLGFIVWRLNLKEKNNREIRGSNLEIGLELLITEHIFTHQEILMHKFWLKSAAEIAT